MKGLNCYFAKNKTDKEKKPNELPVCTLALVLERALSACIIFHLSSFISPIYENINIILIFSVSVLMENWFYTIARHKLGDSYIKCQSVVNMFIIWDQVRLILVQM